MARGSRLNRCVLELAKEQGGRVPGYPGRSTWVPENFCSNSYPLGELQNSGTRSPELVAEKFTKS
eukprot:148747-Rhodomonas_salina.1